MMIAFSLLKDGIDNVSLSLSSIHYEGAKINAIICAEDALLRIKQEDQFNSDIEYFFDEDEDESCQATIVWNPPVSAGQGITEADVDLSVLGYSNGFERSFDYQMLVRQHEVNQVDGSLMYTNNIYIFSMNEVVN